MAIIVLLNHGLQLLQHSVYVKKLSGRFRVQTLSLKSIKKKPTTTIILIYYNIRILLLNYVFDIHSIQPFRRFQGNFSQYLIQHVSYLPLSIGERRFIFQGRDLLAFLISRALSASLFLLEKMLRSYEG